MPNIGGPRSKKRRITGRTGFSVIPTICNSNQELQGEGGKDHTKAIGTNKYGLQEALYVIA